MILKLLKVLASKFWRQYKQVLFQLIVGSLETTIISLISDLKSVDLSDDEKRAAAFRQIKLLAITAGRDLKDNAIHHAISLAIDIIKEG